MMFLSPITCPCTDCWFSTRYFPASSESFTGPTFPCSCLRQPSKLLRNGIVVANILPLHRSIILSSEFAHNCLLRVYQRQHMLGCSEYLLILLGINRNYLCLKRLLVANQLRVGL